MQLILKIILYFKPLWFQFFAFIYLIKSNVSRVVFKIKFCFKYLLLFNKTGSNFSRKIFLIIFFNQFEKCNFYGYTATASTSINQSGLTNDKTPTVERATLFGFFVLL